MGRTYSMHGIEKNSIEDIGDKDKKKDTTRKIKK
jgi:hypothetical protein